MTDKKRDFLASLDEFRDFSASLNENFQNLVLGERLFTTNSDNLFTVFLNNLPSDRQRYTCDACRKFMETYGGLVTISATGKTTPVMWQPDNIPSFFIKSVELLKEIVSCTKVTGVFFSKKSVWGQPMTGNWPHMFVKPPHEHVFRSRLQTAFQASAGKREEFNNMNVILKNDNQLDSGIAEWMKDLHETIDSNKSRKTNIIWRAVANAPAGFCHPSILLKKGKQ